MFTNDKQHHKMIS